MKGVRDYLNAKPYRWTLFFGVPGLLLLLYLASRDGFQMSEVLGIALFVCGFSILGGAASRYGMEVSSIIIWPWWRSLFVYGGPMYLILIGCELATGRFEYGDLVASGVFAIVYASWFTWRTKRDFHPVPPPVSSE